MYSGEMLNQKASVAHIPPQELRTVWGTVHPSCQSVHPGSDPRVNAGAALPHNGEIAVSLGGLDQRVKELSDRVLVLRQRLEPVLNPSTPDVARVRNVSDVPIVAPYANRLGDIAIAIGEIEDAILDVITRLAV
jgi:hypothetical protein